MEPSIVTEASGELGGADKLRARAARYRSLAETLTNPEIIVAALECARELDKEADALDPPPVVDAIRAA